MGHLTQRQLNALARLSGKSTDLTVAISKLLRASRGSAQSFESAMADVVRTNLAFEDAKAGFCTEFGNENISEVLGVR